MSPPRFGVYMLLTNPKRLARLIAIQDVSRREVARAAGWKSHSYLNRLLAGEARNVRAEPAVRIATFLGVDVYDLFLAKGVTDGGQNAKRQSRRMSRPAA